jgi:hypothetical protein
MAEVPDGHIRESPIDGGAVVFVCVRTHFETGVATHRFYACQDYVHVYLRGCWRSLEYGEEVE